MNVENTNWQKKRNIKRQAPTGLEEINYHGVF